MADRRVVALAAIALLGVACRRAPSGSPSTMALADPAKREVLRDLQVDLSTARRAISAQKNPVYALDRLALAAKELAGESDPGVLQLLSDAETIYGLQGPVAWADNRLKDAEANPAAKVTDCASARDMLNRISPKFADRSEVAELVARTKALCPRVRASSPASARGGRGASSPTVDRSSQRDACRHRCDDAAFSCRAACPYCGSCVTGMTWDECNRQCSTCRQGCEQSEKFCQASCGS